MSGARKVNFWGEEEREGQAAELASDDDWFRNDDSQTIMRQKREDCTAFFLALQPFRS